MFISLWYSCSHSSRSGFPICLNNIVTALYAIAWSSNSGASLSILVVIVGSSAVYSILAVPASCGVGYNHISLP